MHEDVNNTTALANVFMTLADNKVMLVSIRSVGQQTEPAFLDLVEKEESRGFAGRIKASRGSMMRPDTTRNTLKHGCHGPTRLPGQIVQARPSSALLGGLSDGPPPDGPQLDLSRLGAAVAVAAVGYLLYRLVLPRSRHGAARSELMSDLCAGPCSAASRSSSC